MVDGSSSSTQADVYGQAASNLVAGSNLEETIQQILDMGGGTWDRDTVVRALRAAFNNPERAVEYLYSVSSPFFWAHFLGAVFLWDSCVGGEGRVGIGARLIS